MPEPYMSLMSRNSLNSLETATCTILAGAGRTAYPTVFHACPQATWRNVKKAVRAMAGAADCRLRDVEAMAELCPRVVLVRNRLMCAALSLPGCRGSSLWTSALAGLILV